MLERTRIRAEALRLLMNGTAAKSRVYDSRVTPWAEKHLPGINVTTPQDIGQGEDAGTAPTFKATTTLQIECVVMAADGWGAKLDALCEQVETKLLANAQFCAGFEAIAAYNTRLQAQDGGECAVMIAVISIDLKYHIEIAPIIDDRFAAAHITVDAIDPADPNTHPDGGPDGRAEGVLKLEMQQ